MPAMSATSSRIPARNLRKPISDLKCDAPKQHIVRPNERLVLRLQPYGRALYSAAAAVTGGMAEWLKAHAWKACIRATVSWVRIPLPPPGAIPAADDRSDENWALQALSGKRTRHQFAQTKFVLTSGDIPDWQLAPPLILLIAFTHDVGSQLVVRFELTVC